MIRTAAAHGLTLDEGPSVDQPIFTARVSVGHAHALWERAARALGPTLPLRVANKSPDDHISPLYFAAMACRTMGEALQLVVERWRYATHAFPAAIRCTGDLVHFRFKPDVDSLGARLNTEYLLADVVRSSRQLAGDEWPLVELVLGHRPPLALSLWEDFCGTPVSVDPAAPGLTIARAGLDLPVRGNLSPATRRFFLDVLDWLAPHTPRLSDRVAESISQSLDTASVDHIACALALSPRTLHRRLAGEGTTFQRLLDEARRDRALRLALDDHPIKAIAAELGFADPRGFRRAFKRWTGLTPQQFRDR